MKVTIQPPRPTGEGGVSGLAAHGGVGEWGNGSSRRTFNAHVGEEKGRADPCDFGLESLFRAAAGGVVLARMLDPVYLACLAPEGQAQPDEFEDGSARLRKRASAQSPIKIHADLGPGRVEEKNSTR